MTRLAYIGLVQFGPQRLKDKDQVFIYVNRRTELMDTIASAPSYHKIEDRDYPVTKYFFNHTQVLLVHNIIKRTLTIFKNHETAWSSTIQAFLNLSFIFS